MLNNLSTSTSNDTEMKIIKKIVEAVTALVLIDKDFSRISTILDCTHLNISIIFATVTDNSSDIVKHFKEFGNYVDNVQNSPLAYHKRCATLLLNLIANNANLKKLDHPALAKCT
ncbi:Uncharacterized protein FWK35_00022651, partial [Aphis craccivora]